MARERPHHGLSVRRCRQAVVEIEGPRKGEARELMAKKTRSEIVIANFKRDCRKAGGKVRRKKLKSGIVKWTCSVWEKGN